jgi:hypothetical protein
MFRRVTRIGDWREFGLEIPRDRVGWQTVRLRVGSSQIF